MHFRTPSTRALPLCSFLFVLPRRTHAASALACQSRTSRAILCHGDSQGFYGRGIRNPLFCTMGDLMRLWKSLDSAGLTRAACAARLYTWCDPCVLQALHAEFDMHALYS
mmetsp:Transcript_122078/g.317155  ORF Transcript_122078/g.317155 Transcript_122078/m.317155 type:complete len:110 (+) Transcript_122078:2476-2805(+)